MRDCIEFQGYRLPFGYGRQTWRGTQWLSHRVAWTLTYGEIPEGMFVLHKCDNPPCINVEHLFLGTHTDNARDRESKGRGRRRPLCGKGHEMTPENTYWSNGSRTCKACKHAYNVGVRAERRQAGRAK